ncbi:helical membrane plugin domain-containing protein [Sporosarcina sp. CAU 1771]
MALPITSIRMKEQTPEEVQQVKIENLQTHLALQDEAIQKIIALTSELNNAGILDAVNAMLKAKEDIAEIAVNQASREPITNLINHVINASGLLTAINPEVSEKLSSSIQSGLHEIDLYGQNGDSVGMLDLIKSINDPDINRAIKYGLHFLKGMGKELNKEG